MTIYTVIFKRYMVSEQDSAQTVEANSIREAEQIIKNFYPQAYDFSTKTEDWLAAHNGKLVEDSPTCKIKL